MESKIELPRPCQLLLLTSSRLSNTHQSTCIKMHDVGWQSDIHFSPSQFACEISNET